MNGAKKYCKMKNKETKQLHLRLPDDDHKFLSKVAQIRNESLNTTVLEMIHKIKKEWNLDGNIVP